MIWLWEIQRILTLLLLISMCSARQRPVEKLFNTSLTIRSQDSSCVQLLREFDEREFAMVSCLLIDKNPTELSRISWLMSSFGFDCTERKGAEEGIKAYREHRPQLLVMEASAHPAMQEFLRLAHSETRRSAKPVVILYADGPDLHDMGRSILQGANDFLVKPFDRNLLQFKLEQAGLLPH